MLQTKPLALGSCGQALPFLALSLFSYDLIEENQIAAYHNSSGLPTETLTPKENFS